MYKKYLMWVMGCTCKHNEAKVEIGEKSKTQNTELEET